MRIWLPLFLAFSLLPTLLVGQAEAADVPTIFDNLKKQLVTGKKKALRDLGTFLNDPSWNEEAKHIITNHSLFTPQEFNPYDDFSRAAFLGFYYEQEHKIKYSHLLHAFYITPVEQQNASYELEQLKIPSEQLSFRFSADFMARKHDPSVLKKEILALTKVVAYAPNPYDFLSYKDKLLEAANPILSKKHRNLVDLLCVLMCHFREESDFKQMLIWEKKELISPKKLIPHLRNLTNISFKGKDHTLEQLLKNYQWKFDSLGNVDEMVRYGYESQIQFIPSHFDEKVHYYGRILAKAANGSHLKFNAFKDLIESKHPSVLFYLAAQIYGNRFDKKNTLFSPQECEAILRRLTKTKLAVKFSDGALYFDKSIEENTDATKNQLLFWANNYENFEWSESGNYFLNKDLKQEEQMDFEVAFQQLSSKDIKVAGGALEKLLEGDTETVLPLIRRYESFLSSVNPGLPNLQGGNLAVLVQLSGYCNLWGISTLLSENILKELAVLAKAESPKTRFALEQKIIDLLTLENITAFEMWALHQNKLVEQSLSAHRIINNFYTKNSCLMIQEEKALKLFLKKAALFQRKKNYIKMMEDTDCVRNFQYGNFSSSDPQINLQMDLLVMQIYFRKSPKLFFEEELHWSDNLFRYLPAPPSDLYYLRFFDYLEKSESEDRKKWVRKYLQRNYSLSMVDVLFENLRKGTEKKLSLKMLNKVYCLSRSNVDQKLLSKQWTKYWKVSKKNPEKVGFLVWKAHLDWLKSQTIVSEIDINQLISSPFRPKNKEKSLKEILTLVSKNRTKKGFTHLSFKNELSVKEHLFYFDSIKMNPSILKDLPNYFTAENRPQVIDFIIKKSKPDDLPIIFNDLIKKQWFRASLAKRQIPDKTVDTVKTILNAYMEDNFWITEMEENTTLANLFLLEQGSKNTLEQLKASVSANLSPGAKIALQELLINEIEFEQIGYVVQIWDQLLKEPPTKPYNFLNKDFGIPFFQMEDPSTRIALAHDLNSLSRKAFYKKYLLEFGITFLEENDTPNFVKVKQILKNDLITPFSGKGGIFRDYYVFGLIKYLEAHFDESLGFHPKLNENQTFYQYNSNKRIEKWLEFLEARNL